MLFTTAEFLLVFLPVALAGFYAFGRLVSHRAAAAWLFVASLFFYGYWMPEYTLLLVGSICVNHLVGRRIAEPGAAKTHARRWLVVGVGFNLALLGYFKYANFFIDNLNLLLDSPWTSARVLLPIGISFYSFTQIAFLVDTYQGKVNEYRFIHYGLFVTYFPHLIAGPVLHHAQMMPQFRDPQIYRFDGANFIAGLAIFGIGLFKKVVLADGIAPYADAVFKPTDAGGLPDAAEAWLGTVAYSLQLYFDFSGYSDMAIGLSWMFNVRLPFNFDSPYRATSISSFWRRWHMTLSAFLRDYLYVAMGGSRHGAVRRYANLVITMLLGGLWHGANWQFVLWGGLHGMFLLINHGFRAMCGNAACARLDRSRIFGIGSWAVTMLAVLVAWVFFRAETLPGAIRMLEAMAGSHVATGAHAMLWNAGLQWSAGAIWCVGLGAIAVLGPNSNRIGTGLLARTRRSEAVRGLVAGFAVSAVFLLLLINTARDSVSAFIYFNF